MQHDGPFERIRGTFGLRAVLLDHLGADAVGALFERPCHREADIAAADDDDPLLLLRRLAEDLERAVHVLDMGEDVDLVACEELVVRIRREEPPVAAHADDDGAQRRKQIGQLPQGRVEDRAVLVKRDAQKLRLAVHEAFGVEGRRRGESLERGLGHLAFRADDHVDRQVVAPVEVGIDRVQVGLRAKTGDLAGDAEDRMGDLAGDHVHLVRIGRGNDHVGIARAGAFEDVGIGGEARNALHVERIGRAAHQFGIVVDDGHIVLLAREMAGDLPADLARAADDDLHVRSPA